MYDIVFISYQEPNADENYNKLLKRFPLAKRVHGVKGIHQAHIAAAKKCFTKMFWIVDADAVILDNFDFSYIAEPWDEDMVHVWRCVNPINDLVYGYGGVKLFPKKPFLEGRPWEIDLSTTIGASTIAKTKVSCETRFNATPDSAFIGAFRECAKLASLGSVFGAIKRREEQREQEFIKLEQHIQKQDWDRKSKSSYSCLLYTSPSPRDS